MRKFKKRLFSGLFVFAFCIMFLFVISFSNQNLMIGAKVDIFGCHIQSSRAVVLSNFVDVLAKNWIWLVFGICSLVLIVSVIIFACVCKKHKKYLTEQSKAKIPIESSHEEVSVQIQNKNQETSETEKNEVKEEVRKADQLEEKNLEISVLTEDQKYAFALSENNLMVNKLSERLDRIEEILSSQKTEKNSVNDAIVQNSKTDLMLEELSTRLSRVETLFDEQVEKFSNKSYDENQNFQLREICKDINDRIDRIQENMTSIMAEDSKNSVDERQDTEFRLALKQLNERVDKIEILANSKTEEKSNVIMQTKQDDSAITMYKVFDERLDRVEALLKEQSENNLKKEIENQQRELDRANQDILVNKIAEKLQSQEKTMSNEELLEKLIERDEPKVQENMQKSETILNKEAAANNIQETTEDFSRFEKNNSQNPKDAVVIEGVKKLTLKEAYAQLSDRQKQYFDMLKIYAQSKPHARAKEAKSYLNIGIGNKLFVKLTIKKNTVVACFALESEELLMLKQNGKGSIKPEETKIKIVDMNSYETATKMIDIRVEQVNREIEITNNLRKEKQKQRYQDSKKT